MKKAEDEKTPNLILLTKTTALKKDIVSKKMVSAHVTEQFLRKIDRSPLDEPAVHIKQEGQSPEGGKLTRLIKRELVDAPTEQEGEEDQVDEREYPESHGHDSGQDEDMAEDLSMAPDIMTPEDQIEA